MTSVELYEPNYEDDINQWETISKATNLPHPITDIIHTYANFTKYFALLWIKKYNVRTIPRIKDISLMQSARIFHARAHSAKDYYVGLRVGIKRRSREPLDSRTLRRIFERMTPSQKHEIEQRMNEQKAFTL